MNCKAELFDELEVQEHMSFMKEFVGRFMRHSENKDKEYILHKCDIFVIQYKDWIHK